MQIFILLLIKSGGDIFLKHPNILKWYLLLILLWVIVQIRKDSLFIFIQGGKPLRLDYTSNDMVLNSTPVITEFHSYDENTIILREKPTIIYYWRAIAFVLILAICVMTAWLTFYILRLLVKRFLH